MAVEIVSRWHKTLVLYRAESAQTVMQAVVEAASAGVDLSGANLDGAYLRWADLDGANLDVANLDAADRLRRQFDV